MIIPKPTNLPVLNNLTSYATLTGAVVSDPTIMGTLKNTVKTRDASFHCMLYLYCNIRPFRLRNIVNRKTEHFAVMAPSETLLPYQNKSLIDMPGETWKDIPGFEGSYQASTMGRVKSLDRVIPHPRLKSQFVKGRILSQSVGVNKNIVTGIPMIDLRVTLTVENVVYYFNTRRLIYITFIDPHLSYKENGLYVINKDYDGYNNRPENVGLMTKKEKQQRAVARNRLYPHLKTADRTNWQKNYSRRKPIMQYDLQGNFIRQYYSIREASRQTGFDNKGIIQVAKGVYKQWKGFVWKYA